MPPPIPPLTPVDLVLLLLIGSYGLSGYRQGWLLASANLAGLALSLYLGLWFYLPLAHHLVSWTTLPYGLAKPAALLVIWSVADLVYLSFAQRLLGRAGTLAARAPLGRLLGLPAGLARGLLVTTVLLTI